MKRSVSQIAWNRDEMSDALVLLKQHGITGLEVAPTLLFDDIHSVTDADVAGVRSSLEHQGFVLESMQSLLYGAPPYTIFDEGERSDALHAHLETVMRIARLLGVTTLTFGSPKNRSMQDPSDPENEARAIRFFTRLVSHAETNGLTISLEANPVEYGCNFLTTTAEVIAFVKKIGHPHLKLNLDIGAILMNHEDPVAVIAQASDVIGHIQVSAPNLGPLKDDAIDHQTLSTCLKKLAYDGFVSMETKAISAGSNMELLEENLKVFDQYYS